MKHIKKVILLIPFFILSRNSSKYLASYEPINVFLETQKIDKNKVHILQSDKEENRQALRIFNGGEGANRYIDPTDPTDYTDGLYVKKHWKKLYKQYVNDTLKRHWKKEDFPNYNYEIRVERDQYTNGTNLFTATALIHEVIDAYFLSIVDHHNYTPSTALPSFPELFEGYLLKEYPNSTDKQDAQHKEMADRYVDPMASALQEYDANYLINYQVYKDLAWGGLKDAPIFDKTFPPASAESNRIKNRYSCESVGRAVELGTPNEQKPVGKPCN